MLNTARDGAYNVSVSPATSALKTEGVTVVDALQISRSAYAISITATGPGALLGTSTTTYNIVETPTAPDLPNPAYPMAVTATDYPTGALSITGINGMALTLNGTPTVGNTVTVKPSPSVFSVLDDAIRDIGGATSSGVASQAVSQALKNLDIGMGRVSAIRGQAGELLNRADRIDDSQSKRAIQVEADRSRAEDIDMVKGISDFQNQQTGYQAALQSYAQIQKLSLFNYIS